MNLLLDYIVCNLCNFNSYFILIELDKRKFIDVVICGLITDLLFGKILFNTLILIIIFLIFKYLKIKNKYLFIKNILIIFVYVFFRSLVRIIV